MALNNGTFVREVHRSGVLTNDNFDDFLYSPEMDNDDMDDRLEQARQNRTGFYRKMLASRNRPLDDYSVTRKMSHRSGSSPVKEPSISDTAPAGPLPQMPEPHSSWRFYTSYDNGEWKRHAVPVHKEEEEILREPTKTVRRTRETDRMTESPTMTSESSLRRMRQNGGPLLACLQPRPRRTSEGQKTTTMVQHMVNGQPVVGVGGGGAEFGGQFGLPADWANGNVVRRFSDGGTEYLVLEEEPAQGAVRHESSTKYTSTVKVTQPGGSQRKPALVSSEQATGVTGGIEGGQGATEESGVRKSRRPRIYGFQEKIIIPTKYKNAENQDSGEGGDTPNETNTGQIVSKNSGTTQQTIVKRGSSMEGGPKVNDRRISEGRERQIQATERGHGAAGGGSPPRKPGTGVIAGRMVKVVVMNSGSDGESEKKPSEEEKEGVDSSPVSKLNAGIMQKIPNLFPKDGSFPMEELKALHESFHANLLPSAASSGKDPAAGSVSSVEEDASLVANQRVFSKDEQTFTEVGPNGAKCDGKVLRTYEVVTSTNEEDSAIQNKLLAPTIEVPVVPVERAERSAFNTKAIEGPAQESSSFKTKSISSTMEVPVVPVGRTQRSSFNTQAIEGPVQESSSFKTMSISSTGDHRRKSDSHPQTGSYLFQHEIHSPRNTMPAVSPKADRKKQPDIFEQTGSLFKTITPRPRNISETESVFAARDEHLRKAAGESIQPNLVMSRTIRVSSNQYDGFKQQPDAASRTLRSPPSTGFGEAETVRTKVHNVSNEGHSSRQLWPSGPAEEIPSVESNLRSSAAEVDGGGFSVQSSTSSSSGGLRSHGWSGGNTQTKRSDVRRTGNEREWEVQVALKD